MLWLALKLTNIGRTIRVWTNEGYQLQELHGHTNYIYSIAALPNGDLVSAGEDRTVRIWRSMITSCLGREEGASLSGFIDGECIQTIPHPAISVWAVAVCPETGDIVSGASDRTARVFSRSPQRWADELTMKVCLGLRIEYLEIVV